MVRVSFEGPKQVLRGGPTNAILPRQPLLDTDTLKPLYQRPGAVSCIFFSVAPAIWSATTRSSWRNGILLRNGLQPEHFLKHGLMESFHTYPVKLLAISFIELG